MLQQRLQQEQSQSQAQSESQAQSRMAAQSVQQQAFQQAVQSGMTQEQAQQFANTAAERFNQSVSQNRTTNVDQASQAFIEQMRNRALSAADAVDPAFFAPSTDAVLSLTGQLANPAAQAQIGALEEQAARSQALTRRNVADAATAAKAFGGSRHGIAEAVRASEIDRTLAAETANILSESHDRALTAAIPLASQQALSPFAALQAQGSLLQNALGPTGTVTTGTGTTTGQTQGTTSGTQQGTTTGTQTQDTTGTSTGRTQTNQQTQQQQQAIQNARSLLQSLGIDLSESTNLTAGRASNQSQSRSRTTEQEQGNFLSGLLSLAGAFASAGGIPGIGALFSGGK